MLVANIKIWKLKHQRRLRLPCLEWDSHFFQWDRWESSTPVFKILVRALMNTNNDRVKLVKRPPAFLKR